MKKLSLYITILCVFFLLGSVFEKKNNFLSTLKEKTSQSIPWDSLQKETWGSEFKVVEIVSSEDSSKQYAYFLAAKDKSPLIVSLHTWSADYQQNDPMSDKALKQGWNYIHPDFRGANNSTDACLSELVISDIDDSISYAIDNGNVDLDNVFIVGVSGGGYTALGSYLRTKHKINTFFSWVPISDLSKWFQQSLSRKQKYSIDILRCTDSEKELNLSEAVKRSPLYWEIPSKLQNIEIYAGIKDGYFGSVPVSHSIDFYNKIAALDDKSMIVTPAESMSIMSKGIFESTQMIDDRKLLFNKKSSHASITIFDGGHEMLTDYTFERMKELIK